MDSFRKWLAFGTGVGVEVRDQQLQVTIVRVRRSETAVLGAATVTDFKNRPAAEWGTELSEFLRSVGAAHIALNVLLPRRDVIVRTLQMPGVSDRDAEAAIRLQVDSLHPFSEDEIYFSWARIAKTPFVLVGIARREVVDQLSSIFAEAGLKVASFTFSAAALYSALRLAATPPADGFVVAHESEREIEVYGESPTKPVFSASFPAARERSIHLAKSELRLEPELEPALLTDLLPKPAIFPENHNPDSPEYEQHTMPYAAALAGACPWLSLDGNLLPLDQRRGSSRVRLIPTFALGTILAAMLIALAFHSRWSDSRYLGVLQHEIRRLEPQARRVETLNQSVSETRARTLLLDDYRRRAKYDMDALAEVTKLIPPPGWVGSMDLDRQTLQIAGEAEQAASLLKSLDNSPLFERSEFTMPISKTPSGENFRIRAARSVGLPPAAPGKGAAQSSALLNGFNPGMGAMAYPGYQPSAGPLPAAPAPPLIPLPGGVKR